MSRTLASLSLAFATLAFAVGVSAAEGAATTPVTKPYPLDTCPVSGDKLDQDQVVKVYDGREVKFCCAKCPAKYEANRAEYDAKIDAAAKAKTDKPAADTKPAPAK